MKVRHWVALVVVCGTALGACDWFEDPSPESVRVQINGPVGDSLMVVTSTEFVASQSEEGTVVTSFASDTTVWSLPVEQTFNIRQEQRFMIFGVPQNPQVTLSIDGVVRVDSRSPWNFDVDVTGEQPFQFLFLFNQPIVDDFQLL